MQLVAESFAKISNLYNHINREHLPAYLPALPPPKITPTQVMKKLENQKRTKSTLPIDIPQDLKKEVAPFIAEPLSDIYNSCLENHVFCNIWKKELVSPVPKSFGEVKTLKDIRKIACTLKNI